MQSNPSEHRITALLHAGLVADRQAAIALLQQDQRSDLLIIFHATHAGTIRHLFGDHLLDERAYQACTGLRRARIPSGALDLVGKYTEASVVVGRIIEHVSQDGQCVRLIAWVKSPKLIPEKLGVCLTSFPDCPDAPNGGHTFSVQHCLWPLTYEPVGNDAAVGMMLSWQINGLGEQHILVLAIPCSRVIAFA